MPLFFQFTISCKEEMVDSMWVDVGPEACVPFWPIQTSKKMNMVARIKDTKQESKPFCFTESHTTLLKLDHEVVLAGGHSWGILIRRSEGYEGYCLQLIMGEQGFRIAYVRI